MVIDYAVMLILVNKEEERLTNQAHLHYVIVSGKKESRIPSICRTVAASYLEKHPEYRLAFSESWEYLGRAVTIDVEEGGEN